MCLVGEENWQENWWGLGVFSLVLPECNLPNSGENSRENDGQKVPLERDQITTCNIHIHFHFVIFFFFFDHAFLLSFCLFLLLFIPFGCSSVFSFLICFGFFFPNQFYFSSVVLDFCTLFYLFFYIVKFTSIHNFSIKI